MWTDEAGLASAHRPSLPAVWCIIKLLDLVHLQSSFSLPSSHPSAKHKHVINLLGFRNDKLLTCCPMESIWVCFLRISFSCYATFICLSEIWPPICWFWARSRMRDCVTDWSSLLRRACSSSILSSSSSWELFKTSRSRQRSLHFCKQKQECQ